MDSFLAALTSLWAQWLWPIIQLVIGLGLVIFVHELGHFLVAKWVGIRVDRFALGFGPRLAGFQRGETDYCVNLLPLGGYVKMLGQEDFKPLDGEQSDPRAFTNKPVWARLAVVSAGVVMNAIFAALLFVLVCLVGFQQIAPVIGAVIPGSPAAEAEIVWQGAAPPSPVSATTEPATTQASRPTTESRPAALDKPDGSRGLRPGDRILEIDGDRVPHFQKLFVAAALARRGQVFHMTIEREVGGARYVGLAKVGVAEMPSEMGGTRLAFGLGPAQNTVLDANDQRGRYLVGDRVVAIHGREVPNSWTIDRIEKTLDGRRVKVTFERDGRRWDAEFQPVLFGGDVGDVVALEGSRLFGKVLRQSPDELTIRLENGQEKTLSKAQASVSRDELLDILGMAPRLQVEAVEEDSSADKAGMKAGDVIVNFGDRPSPSLRTLLRVNEEFVGKETHITVCRDGKTLGPMKITPKQKGRNAIIGITNTIDVTSATVASVRPGSAADKAGIRPGDVIEAADGKEVKTWIDVFHALRHARSSDVSISVRRNARQEVVTISGFGPAVFDPSKYEFSLPGLGRFRPLEVTIVEKNPVAAVSWGLGETWDFIVMSYSTIRGLMQRTVSTKEVVGPVGIGGLAIEVGRRDLVRFLYFLAMISVSLAVMNFLPIPVVDGGIAVFLLIEKIRGRPAPRKVMNAVQMVGLALLLLIFVAVTWQDIVRLVRNAW